MKHSIKTGGRRFSITVSQQYTHVVLQTEEDGVRYRFVMTPDQAGELGDDLMTQATHALDSRRREAQRESDQLR